MPEVFHTLLTDPAAKLPLSLRGPELDHPLPSIADLGEPDDGEFEGLCSANRESN